MSQTATGRPDGAPKHEAKGLRAVEWSIHGAIVVRGVRSARESSSQRPGPRPPPVVCLVDGSIPHRRGSAPLLNDSLPTYPTGSTASAALADFQAAAASWPASSREARAATRPAHVPSGSLGGGARTIACGEALVSGAAPFAATRTRPAPDQLDSSEAGDTSDASGPTSTIARISGR